MNYKWIFQEDEYADFIANDAISVFINVTEKNNTVGHTFGRYDDHSVFCRHITNEIHIPELRECIRIDHKLHVKLFLQGSPDYFYSDFGVDIIAS